MKALCRKTCQIRLGDKIMFVEAGEVLELDSLPEQHFVSLEDDKHSVDFLAASEAELLQAKWKLTDAQKAVWDAYKVKLVHSEGETKKDLVAKILDARYRSADVN